MARYKRYRKRFKSYGRRAGGYGRKAYNKVGFSLSPAFIAGFVVGFTNIDEKIPAEFRILSATMPIKGMGVVKAFAQGMLLGNIVQQYVGGAKLGSGSSGGFGI